MLGVNNTKITNLGIQDDKEKGDDEICRYRQRDSQKVTENQPPYTTLFVKMF